MSGRSYVFDVRRSNLTPGLHWLLTTPTITKVVWDLDSENSTFSNTFGLRFNTQQNGFVDAQNWALDHRVQEGKKSGLAYYVGLYTGKNIKPFKKEFHRFNWNTPSWQFPDTQRALWYSACDPLFNLQVALGLAATKTWTPPMYRVTAELLRTNGLRL